MLNRFEMYLERFVIKCNKHILLLGFFLLIAVKISLPFFYLF